MRRNLQVKISSVEELFPINAQNGRSFDLRILERKKDNVGKTIASI